MDCPKCGSSELRTTVTNGHQSECVTRKRKCQTCNHAWFTVELSVSQAVVGWGHVGPTGQSKPVLRVPVSLAVGDGAV
jgi:transcriptional regulator NrdR family protein